MVTNTNDVKVGHSELSNHNSPSYNFSQDLNVEFLNKTYGHNLSFCANMFKVFLSTIVVDMNNLKNAISANDFLQTEAIAHKIKNNFIWVGLPQLSKQMYEIETKAREESTDLKQLLMDLTASFDQSLKYVESEFINLKEFISV